LGFLSKEGGAFVFVLVVFFVPGFFFSSFLGGDGFLVCLEFFFHSYWAHLVFPALLDVREEGC
jgi:hypothetical protein